MKRSTTRFLTTHMGSLARPDDLSAMLTAKDAGEPYDADALAKRVTEAVAEVVKEQAANGIDIVNDGEFSKFSWAAYFADRLGGIERRQQQAADVPPPISARDMQVFPEWFAIVGPGGSRDLIRRVQQPNVQGAQIVGGTTARRAYCTGPLTYIGQKDTATDIANLKAAAQGVQVEELYLSALSPVTAEYFVTNQYYKTQEELVFAYAEAMNQEYRAITDAGILLADRRAGDHHDVASARRQGRGAVPPLDGAAHRGDQRRAQGHPGGPRAHALLLGQLAPPAFAGHPAA